MTFAIHNLHSPAVEIDATGTMTHDGHTRIPLPAPLHVADTAADAEAWRAEARDGREITRD